MTRMTTEIDRYVAEQWADGRFASPATEQSYRYTLSAHAEDCANRDPRFTDRDDIIRTLARWQHRAHCRACNTCFSGDRAFDTHRTFAEGHKNDWAYRTCLDPIDDWRFAVKDRGGVCALRSAFRRHPVRIWTLRTHLEKTGFWERLR